MTKNFDKLNEDTLRRTAEYSSISSVDENEEADLSEQERDEMIESLVSRCLFRLLHEEEKDSLILQVSTMIDGPGDGTLSAARSGSDNMCEVGVKLVHPAARPPQRMTPGSAG